MKIATKRAVTAYRCACSQPAPSRRVPTAFRKTAGGGDQQAPRPRQIGLLLPESKTTRYESDDRPLFEAKVKELCSDCEVLYSNADQDAAKQQQQAESALTQGVKVLVLDPVDSRRPPAIVVRPRRRTCRSSPTTA